MYLDVLREKVSVSQGDIVHNIPFSVLGTTEDTRWNGMAIILSHDCEYDKPHGFVLVAEVRLLHLVDSGSQGNIRNLRTLNTFYLQEREGTFEESFVDFRRLSTVRKELIESRAHEGVRIASLDDPARTALQRQIAIFFGIDR